MKLKPLQVHVRFHEEEINLVQMIINIITLFIFIIIIVPSIVLLIAKDSLPTDSVYAAKRFFENSFFSIASSNFFLKSEVSSLLLQQRFDEVDKLLVRYGSEMGLIELIYQARETGQIVLSTPGKSQRYKLILRFSETIDRYEKSLETRRVELVAKNEGGVQSIRSTIDAVEKTKQKLEEIKKEIDSKKNY